MSEIINFPGAQRPRVAVIGSGIAGLSAAWKLSDTYDVMIFEREDRPGGHSHTSDVDCAEGTFPVDTGFIVYNDANYPNLTALFDHLGVETHQSDMSFAASLQNGSFEYSGSGLSGLFAQKRNLLRPRMWRMIGDILRLYKEGPADAAIMDSPAQQLSLDAYLDARGYSRAFRHDHILPMCAAIWSSPVGTIGEFPAKSFLSFFENHGLMRLSDRPKWRTVTGGSRAYVNRLLDSALAGLECGAEIKEVTRQAGGVAITFSGGRTEQFDQVVFACHSDQALALLGDPTRQEKDLLGAMRYQDNMVYLHCDTAHMPRRKSVWSSWNYISDGGAGAEEQISLTYWMNRLQKIPTTTPLLVTLNPTIAPDPDKTWHQFVYSHPVFDAPAMTAQQSLWQLQGARQTWFCGAYWGYGFHEDGIQSGLAVAEAMGAAPRPWTTDRPMDRLTWPDHPLHGEPRRALGAAAE